ncbi:MAG: PAS domain S-box protein [Anaerolineae bacterium]|nr:PAS domain S-box protein [Anaerolineae bacterium]
MAKKVLIVDDNPPSRYAVGRVLRQGGFETIEAATGAEALAAARTKPDLIVLDINLPDINGFNICQQIRSDPEIMHTPILMISATYLDSNSQVTGLSSGADGYLTHPVEPPVLLAYVNALLRTSQAEKSMRVAAQQWESTFDALSNGICITDSTGRVQHFNRALPTILGMLPEEITGRNCQELLGVSIFASLDNPVSQEELLRGRWLHITTNPIMNETGQLDGFVHILTDITERKQAEESLRRYSEQITHLYEVGKKLGETLDLQMICDTAYAAIVQIMPCDSLAISSYTPADNLIRYVYAQHNGTPLDVSCFPPIPLEPDGQEIQSLVIQSKEPLYLADYQRYRQTTQNYYEQGLLNTLENPKDKSLLRSALIVPLMYEGEAIGVIQILSHQLDAYSEDSLRYLNALAPQVAAAMFNARLVAELEQRVMERTAQLALAKERTEAILNSSKDMIILCRPDGMIEQVNPAFEETIQYAARDAFGQPLIGLIQGKYVEEVEQAFAGVIETRQSRRLETGIQYKNRVLFDADVVFSPIIGGDGVVGVVCSMRDITERKQMEAKLRQLLEHEMEVSELKSRYVSMAAHDLRNPLAVIKVGLSLLDRYADRLTPEQKRAKFDEINNQIDVMVKLLDNILIFGRLESGRLVFNPASLDVVAFCQEVIDKVRLVTAATHAIEFSSQGDCQSVNLDANLLRNILSNLLSNAIKYSPGKRSVKLTVDCGPSQVVFRVQDQGVGISETDQARLFEPFYRGQDIGDISGTGLGLAIVKQSVDLHGGTIVFESQKGQGTVFTVTLPNTPLDH